MKEILKKSFAIIMVAILVLTGNFPYLVRAEKVTEEADKEVVYFRTNDTDGDIERGRKATSIVVKNAGQDGAQGWGCGFKYIQTDATDKDNDGTWRMVYCLNQKLDSTDSEIGWDGQGIINKQIAYAAAYGVRFWGKESEWTGYRTGLGWKADYAATTYAIHVLNKETTLEKLATSAGRQEFGAPGAEDGAVWNIIQKIVKDAQSEANYTSFINNYYVPKNLNHEITPGKQEQWTKTTHNGVAGYRTSEVYHQNTSEARNLSSINAVVDGANTYNATVVWTKNTALKVEASSNAADFYIFVPETKYKEMLKTGGVINVNLTGNLAYGFSTWRYQSADPKEQPVTYLEVGGTPSSINKMVTAVVNKKYNLSQIKVKKVGDNGEILSNVNFTIYEWSKIANNYIENSNMEFLEVENFYQSKNLLETDDNLGKFKVVETKGQAGFINNNWSKEFNVAKEENFTYTATNVKMTPKLKVAKLAEYTTGATLENGRYKGQKLPGLYEGTVKYKIDVTNSGNVAAKDIHLTDKLDTKLENMIEPGSSKFIITSGIKTQQGKEVKVIAVSDKEVKIDTLEPGDALTIQYQVELKQEAKMGAGLNETFNNIVKVTGNYNDNDGDKPIPNDGDDQDNDYIKIANPKVKIAKLAQNTKGVTLVDGRYVGEKIPAYYEGKICYKILVTNSGNITTKNLRIVDEMEEKLKNIVKPDSSKFLIEENVQTTNGNTVHLSSTVPTEVMVDSLESGDSIAITFETQLNENANQIVGLDETFNNLVRVSGTYDYHGIELPIAEDGDDWDADQIRVIVAKLKIAKLADRTTGVELENGRYTGLKEHGGYDNGENVKYAIDVTNSGNTTVEKVKVKDIPEVKLKDIIKESGFDVNSERVVLKTNSGNSVTVYKSGQNEVTLSSLDPGDSVRLQYLVKLKNDANVNKQLDETFRNVVEVTGCYNNDTPVIQDEDDTDADDIGLEKASLKVAKIANRTTNQGELKDGKYTGKKTQGLYEKNEEVIYQLTATNNGNTEITGVVLKENISDALKKFIVKGSSKFDVQAGDVIKSKKGNYVKVKEVTATKIVLDKLLPQDSVELQYKIVLIEDLKAATELENTVTINGTSNGKQVAEDTDTDKIRTKEIKVTTVTKTESLGNGNTTTTKQAGVKTGDATEKNQFIILGGISLALIWGIGRRTKRKPTN